MTLNFFLSRVVAAAFAVAVTIAVAPALAAAQTQTTPATPANQGGPMVIEQVEQHFTIAPEFKISTFDGDTAQLAGAHGGVFVTKTVLVGGGFYTQTNGTNGRGLSYGGAVVGWQPWSNGWLGLNLRGLVGFGRGTTSETITQTARNGRNVRGPFRVSSDLFVAEPQVDLLIKLTKHLQLGLGGGYRAVNASRVDNDRFSGASGGISLRIGSPM